MKKLRPGIADGIRNIIFDFGGVLLDLDISRTIDAFARLNLNKLDPKQIHPYNHGLFLDFEIGEISPGEFIARLKDYIPETRPTDEQIVGAWNAMLLDYDWRRFELLDELRASGYGVFLLSNTNVLHREFFIEKFNRENPEQREFENYFDRCFYSDTMGMRKPDGIIYQTALKEAGIDAARTLFIDDTAVNTDAARETGIQAHHLSSPSTVLDLFESVR